MSFSPSELPTEEQLVKARALSVQDERGDKVRFGELVEGRRCIVVFIRHFFCGLCQDYLSFLSAHLPPSLLSTHSTTLLIIGCGAPAFIAPYRARLALPAEFALYADPDKKLYEALGMTRRTLELGEKTPEYVRGGMLGNVFGSIANAFRFGKVASPGDMKQVGGEFVFDAEGNTVWCHRMENTRDHAPLKELLHAAGIPYEEEER
ncbi:hypothetical protein JCM10450v2_003957 [Rhodotorula kratochvilovae]